MTLEQSIVASGLPRLEGQALAAYALGLSRLEVITRAEQQLSVPERARLDELFARRRQGEPVAYLVGAREFFSLDFRVGPSVLIPRPESELLVEFALEHIPPGTPRRLLDLGTGSGCIAISIARHRPLAAITAVDSSAAALAMAGANAQLHGACAVELMCSDWFAALGGRRFDVIVANPPYIRAEDPHLAAGDLRFEPRTALAAGPDGLASIRAIAASAAPHLERGGWIAFEHGYDQAQQCRALLREAGFASVFSRRDLAGIERVTAARAGGGP